METQRRRLSGKSALGKALQYALGRWDALARYVEDGRLSIDNNLAERQLRGVAVTRKNFLFLGSDSGGQRAAIIYTIAETAKLNGLDPEAYIAAILDRLARGHPIIPARLCPDPFTSTPRTLWPTGSSAMCQDICAAVSVASTNCYRGTSG